MSGIKIKLHGKEVEKPTVNPVIETEAEVVDIAPLAPKPVGIVSPAVTAEQATNIWRTFQEIKKRIIMPGLDTVKIKDSEFITKSGWRKLATVFHLSDEVIEKTKEEFNDENGKKQFVWYVTVKVTHKPSGRSVVNMAACASNERGFAHLEHDCLAMAVTRAKNRAISDIIGSGEASFEEITSPSVDEGLPK